MKSKRKRCPSVKNPVAYFPYIRRGDIDLSCCELRRLWEEYSAFLKSIGVSENSELYIVFARDFFRRGKLEIRKLNLREGLLCLAIENTSAINQVHEIRGDEWALANIVRKDFTTKITFTGVDFFLAELDGTNCVRYLGDTEIGVCRDRFQMYIDLRGYTTPAPCLRFTFKSVSVENISKAMEKYELPNAKIVLPHDGIDAVLYAERNR